MAATAAMVIVSAGSMVYQNQVAQKQKGEQAKLLKAAQAQQDQSLQGAPDVTQQQATAQAQGNLAGQQARKKALASSGRRDTILTGARGVEPGTTPLERKTLLGL